MIVPASEAMRLCVQRMETLSPDDTARLDVRAIYAAADVRTIYTAAAQIHAAWIIASATCQVDDRIDIPDWLAPTDTESDDA